ncbi:MAG: hypothetical protein KAQ68_07805, partial [Clostridiales bacterium]|nr:hypothetical protein [Clostridiales bacterium]
YKDSSLRLSGYFNDENEEAEFTNAAMYTDIIRRTISIVEENNGSAISTFTITHGEDGKAKFYFSTDNEKIKQVRLERWLKNMLIPSEYYKSGDDFYSHIKESIKNSKDEEDPYYGYEYYEGITDKEIKDILAQEVYLFLRDRYKIPGDVSYDEAFKVLSVWQEAQLSSYRSYTPVLISDDVNMDTVAAIEMRKIDLYGMEIRENNIRIYPKNELAAHIVGYMGRILDESTVMEKVDIGYSREDLIGISGIEATMEGELTPNLSSRTGMRIVEVNSRGKIVAQKGIISPIDGNDVILTIDINMQKKLEEALAQNIMEVQSTQREKYQRNEEDYLQEMKTLGRISINTAEVGAAVVFSVQSGAILAMASYPSFDPNIFAGGLTEAEYDTMKYDERNPLFNKAIAARAAPGSIFKMVTAVAGLMEGKIETETLISDEGPWPYDIESGTAPACWIGKNYHLHSNQNLTTAIKNSCNYYFFTVAKALGIDLLNKWADLLGLSSETNVELQGEMAGQVANPDSLYVPTQSPSGTSKVVYNSIRKLIVDKCKDPKVNIEHEDEVYDKAVLDLMLLARSTTDHGPDIRGILKNDIGLTQFQINNVPYQKLDLSINADLLALEWTPIKTILTGIGQSVTLLTPIAVARYVAAIVNGGNVYEARLVKSIVSPDGQIIEEIRPQLIRTLDIPQEYTDSIKAGMKSVVSLEDGGTAAKYFADFKYKDDIGGKTGTAQVSQIDLENNAWFVSFAPYEQPEIVVVVFIPHGYSGGTAAYTAKEIMEFYLDRKLVEVAPAVIPAANDLTQ